MECEKCKGNSLVKNGMSRHKNQRWLCKECGHTQGEYDRRKIGDDIRKVALHHYVEGVGLRATERLVGVSHNSIMNWVHEAVDDKMLAKVQPETVGFVEADELYTFVGKKNKMCGSGGLLIAIPSKSAAGRWAIVAPKRPSAWMRNFLADKTLPSAPTSGTPTA